jgi:hypothetical protein
MRIAEVAERLGRELFGLAPAVQDGAPCLPPLGLARGD